MVEYSHKIHEHVIGDPLLASPHGHSLFSLPPPSPLEINEAADRCQLMQKHSRSRGTGLPSPY